MDNNNNNNNKQHNKTTLFGSYMITVLSKVMKKSSLAVFLSVFSAATAMPTLLLTDAREHCVNVEASDETFLRVHYEISEEMYDRTNPDYSETSITIGVEPFHRVMDTKLHNAPVRHRLRPTNAVLDEATGSLMHQFEMDGKGHVCVTSRKASPHRPLMFKFRLQSDSDEESIKEEKEAQGDFSQHLTRMEMEIGRIEKSMHGVLKNADFLKEQDAKFHKQAQDMDSATMFWPIVQVCVLLMTGFTQARHIVEFFKQRRII